MAFWLFAWVWIIGASAIVVVPAAAIIALVNDRRGEMTLSDR